MKSYQLIVAATAICGCGGGPVTAKVVQLNGGANPHKTQIEDDGVQVYVYTELGLSQCNLAGAKLQVQEPFIQLGPLTVRTKDDTSKGFFLAWSVCNPTNAATPPTSYGLLDSVGGGPPQTLHTFTAPAPPSTALQPCSCDPEIVFIDVPVGDDSVIALVSPTQRINGAGAGLHEFTLSAPFSSTLRADVKVQ
jgi:hypothetical protein